MKLSTISNAVLLSLSLSLVGCGGGGGGGGDDSPEPVVPAPTPAVTLSVANPIADMTASVGDDFDFSLPTDVCTSNDGAAVTHTITSLQSSLGLSLVNFNQLTGTFTAPGTVTATVTCVAGSNTTTDEFTITVADVSLPPTVTIQAPSFATTLKNVLVAATAQDGNVSGSIVSYLWEQTSGPTITLGNTSLRTIQFVAPDTTVQSQVTFSITVTDNDGETAIETVTIDLVSSLAPTPTLSFPLQVGSYSANEIEMFGKVVEVGGDTVQTVTVILDEQDYPTTLNGNTWRSTDDIPYTDDATITIKAESATGLIGYEKIELNHNTVYGTDIDNNVSDIAVNESTDEVYVQANGDLIVDRKFLKFNIGSKESGTLTINQPAGFAYSTAAPSTIALNPTSNILYVGYDTAITQIDLTTNTESILSDVTTGTGGTGTDLGLILDLNYDEQNDVLYTANNASPTSYLQSIDTTTGDKLDLLSAGNLLSIVIDPIADLLYLAQGLSPATNTTISKYDVVSLAITPLSDVPAGNNGGPISDIAVNNTGNELFFIDGSGDLIKHDLSTNLQTVVKTALFAVEETIVNAQTPLIGIHYHSERNIVIVAGKGTDGVNKLLAVDPVSGDYATLARGN